MEGRVYLKQVLKDDGRSQLWLRDKLAEYGIVRDPAQISLWCRGKYIPRDDYIIRVIADILEKDYELIRECFYGNE